MFFRHPLHISSLRGDIPEQPFGVQAFIYFTAIGLLLFSAYTVETKNLSVTPMAVAFGLGIVISVLFFRKTGLGGEPIAEIPVTQEVYRAVDTGKPAQSDSSDFHDEELDRLIDKGEYREAREYLDNQLRMAKEMGDVEGQHNYSKYHALITQVSMEDTRRLGYSEDDIPRE